ncbi:alpha/beta hydrolase [Sphingomonas psychrotolerans]|uniref:Alpha/beta hydrolase n=1 Tax=Sphingomonas psychrotolerans TaxID=1327635 RepID=A0A2K8MCW5_9SPHN|nr:alpha/beta hydrolase [Sphingomonas psychrotolerans]ATY31740.1 alpha/beta hydrolase [Sphingomonas psychrotolerans]
MTAEEATFTSAGELDIFYRVWQPAAAPRAVVVICHGVNSHGGQHAWAAERFVESGYVVLALDLRGRGRSAGERFYVEDIADYVADVAGTIGIAKARYPGLKLFLLGHSAGGVTSASYVLDHQAEIDGFICESFAFQVPAPGFALAAIKGLSHIAPRLGVLKLKNEDFSRDPEWVAALNADPLIENETQPAATVAALVRADERLREEFPTITLPVLILHGTADKATVCEGSVFFHETAGSADKTLKLYKDHYHDLLADVGKEEVMADIKAWLEAHL